MTTQQHTVDRFNQDHPIGTRVKYWKGCRDGFAPSGISRTSCEAYVLHGHTAVVHVDGYTPAIALTHIERTTAGEPLAAGGIPPWPQVHAPTELTGYNLWQIPCLDVAAARTLAAALSDAGWPRVTHRDTLVLFQFPWEDATAVAAVAEFAQDNNLADPQWFGQLRRAAMGSTNIEADPEAATRRDRADAPVAEVTP